MQAMQKIKQQWEIAFAEMSKSPAFQKVINQTLTVEEYKAVLKQIYFYTRETPQLIALMTLHWRGNQRRVVGSMLRHAAAEVGHENLALHDLEVLGEDVSKIPFERPLPATSAMLGYSFYQIQHENPVGFLGYLFHLECMPTTSGEVYTDCLSKIGVPKEAMTFIDEHAVVDMAHNKLMENYFEKLELTDDDVDEIIYSARVAASLYAKMIEEAIASVRSDYNWGISGQETSRTSGINSNELRANQMKVEMSTAA